MPNCDLAIVNRLRLEQCALQSVVRALRDVMLTGVAACRQQGHTLDRFMITSIAAAMPCAV